MISIIPTPKKIKTSKGKFNLSNTVVGVDVKADIRIKKAASNLCREIGEKTCEIVPLTVSEKGNIKIGYTNKGGEGYILKITANGIEIKGNSAAGAFYGIQSLRQLVKSSGKNLPCCEIEDEPDYKYRGFYQDITRGRVNSPEKLREIADFLAYYKVNALELYVEDAFTFKELEGIVTAQNALTPEEIIELDNYCYDNFIELEPSLSTFGHLFTLLQSEKYNCICELEGHKVTRNYWLEKQWHHTVDVYNPKTFETIKSMIEQYIPLFRSNKFNICCDETLDLCNGKNKGKDKGEAYFHHVTKLCELLKSHGKTVMMWGDECMAHPEMMKEKMPKDTVVLNWCYHKTVNEWFTKFFSEQGFDQIVCPGTSSWSHFIEDVDTSEGNINDLSSYGKKYNAMGLLNTNWGDFGHICPFNCNLYGTVYGAQKCWNTDAPIDEKYRKAVDFFVYGSENYNMYETILNLGKAEKTADWYHFVVWQSDTCLEGKERKLNYNEEGDLTYEDAKKAVEICEKEIAKLKTLRKMPKEIKEDLILSAEGILLMNREYMLVNGDGDETKEKLQKDFDEWLVRYKKAWLRSDKPSQLDRLSDYFSHITEVPVK